MTSTRNNNAPAEYCLQQKTYTMVNEYNEYNDTEYEMVAMDRTEERRKRKKNKKYQKKIMKVLNNDKDVYISINSRNTYTILQHDDSGSRT